MAFIDHNYPEQFKIIDDPYITHLTAHLSTNDCVQPEFNRFVKKVFQQIFIHIMNNEWPKEKVELKTRMTDLHPEVRLQSNQFLKTQKGVLVDVARAGMLPSQIFFDELTELVNLEGLRIDHIFASRATNEKGEVTGTDISGSKIGGDVDDSILIIPDPMGATGSSLCEVIDHYKKNVPGKISKIIAAHMIITPEYIKKLNETHPEVIVYSARLDRGFSSEKALTQPPGSLWAEECGLNDSQYIVPGAGGVGELINNSFV